jgi:hypothetical protein
MKTCWASMCMEINQCGLLIAVNQYSSFQKNHGLQIFFLYYPLMHTF